MIQSYKELVVWQKSMELCTLVYKITDKFPKSEQFGITSQIRRCCISIPSNIAEGYSRGHKQEYVQFLRVAYGSGAELETQLSISKNIGFLSSAAFEDINTKLQEILKMLNKLIHVISR